MISPFAWNRRPRFGFPFRRPVALVFVLAGLLCALASPRLHAQIANWPGGDIDVSTHTLTIREGETGSYRLRLNQPISADGWWVRVFVDGSVRPDGVYTVLENEEPVGKIRWIPSVGRGFSQSDWEEGEGARNLSTTLRHRAS